MKNAGAVIWAVALLCAASSACAQRYPAKPIRIVVGFPPGGGNDIIARMVGAKMQENWGQPVVIDHAARQRNRRHVGPPRAVYDTELPYDLLEDFVPISLVGSFPLVLVVHPSAPANSV